MGTPYGREVLSRWPTIEGDKIWPENILGTWSFVLWRLLTIDGDKFGFYRRKGKIGREMIGAREKSGRDPELPTWQGLSLFFFFSFKKHTHHYFFFFFHPLTSLFLPYASLISCFNGMHTTVISYHLGIFVILTECIRQLSSHLDFC